MTNSIDLSQWNAQAASKWRRWWFERLQKCGLSKAALAKASCAGESEGSVANNLTLLIDGDLRGLKRYFHPAPQSLKSSRDRLERLAKAISLPAEPVSAADLAQLVAQYQQPDEPLTIANPWHPAFPMVPKDAVSVPVPVPQLEPWRRDAKLTTVADWLVELAKKRDASRNEPPWLWIVGEPGSGRCSVLGQVQTEALNFAHFAGDNQIVCFASEPASGYRHWRTQNPAKVVVAVADVATVAAVRLQYRDLEWPVAPWTYVQVADAARLLAESGFIDDAAYVRLGKLASTAEADPEVLGPDKRPAAVIAMLAAVVAGEPVLSSAQARANYRTLHAARIKARLSAASPFGGEVETFLAHFWRLRLTESSRADWRVMTREEAELLAERAAGPLWAPVDRGRATELVRAVENDKLTVGQIRHRLSALRWACRATRSELIDSLVVAGEFVIQGDIVRAASRVASLVMATSNAPDVPISAAVLAGAANLDIAREWALAGVPTEDVVARLAAAQGPLRPFAWYWLLAFAWERRGQLSNAWVKRHLTETWAGAVAATLYGYGDMDVYQVFHGRPRHDEVTALLVRVSLHWSGVLPDLDPIGPWADLSAKVAPADLQRLFDWHELCKRVRDLGHQQVGAQWLTPLLYTALHRMDPHNREPCDEDLCAAANEALRWLAPGQLLGLVDGAAVAEPRIFDSRQDDRLQAAVRRANEGDVEMQAWLAGEPLPPTDTPDRGTATVSSDHAYVLWCSAPVGDRLKWLRMRTRGAERDLTVMHQILFVRRDNELAAIMADQWPSICAILEAQPRDRLHGLVSESALPWRRGRRRGIAGLSASQGLQLAERFGFDDVLESALEAPRRWLHAVRAVRCRGKLVLALPRTDGDGRDWRCRFGETDGVWDGLGAADEFALFAAKALHRRGRPEALCLRAAALPDWPVGPELLADLAAIGPSMLPFFYANDELKDDGGESETADLLNWLSQAVEDTKHQKFRFLMQNEGFGLHQLVHQELAAILSLVNASARFEVAACEIRRCFEFREKDDPSREFWNWAAQPRAQEMDRGQRIFAVIRHALWLWSDAALPAALAKIAEDMRKRDVVWQFRLPKELPQLVPWENADPLPRLALDSAERANVALIEFGDMAPLRHWAAQLKDRADASDWFVRGIQSRLSKQVKSNESMQSKAVSVALAQPLPANPESLPVANHVLNEILAANDSVAAWPPWLDATLLPHHAEVAWRYVRGSSSRLTLSALPTLVELYDQERSESRKIWIALQIERLTASVERLQPHVHLWLTADPEPFVGAPTADQCASPLATGGLGFADLLAAVDRLRAAAVISNDEVGSGLLRLAVLAPVALQGVVDPSDDTRTFLRIRFDQSAEEWLQQERAQALRDVPKTLVRLAANTGSAKLARQICSTLAEFGRLAERDVPALAKTDDDLVANLATHDPTLPFDTEQAREPDYAAQDLLARGAESEAVRAHVHSRLRQGVAQAGSETELAYLLGLLAPLGQSAWRAGVDLLPAARRRLILAESLAQGFARSMSDLALAVVLQNAGAESTAPSAKEMPPQSNEPPTSGQTT